MSTLKSRNEICPVESQQIRARVDGWLIIECANSTLFKGKVTFPSRRAPLHYRWDNFMEHAYGSNTALPPKPCPLIGCQDTITNSNG